MSGLPEDNIKICTICGTHDDLTTRVQTQPAVPLSHAADVSIIGRKVLYNVMCDHAVTTVSSGPGLARGKYAQVRHASLCIWSDRTREIRYEQKLIYFHVVFRSFRYSKIHSTQARTGSVWGRLLWIAIHGMLWRSADKKLEDSRIQKAVRSRWSLFGVDASWGHDMIIMDIPAVWLLLD